MNHLNLHDLERRLDAIDAQLQFLANARNDRANTEEADGWFCGAWHRFLKRLKSRRERRRAKQNPECRPGYNRHNGYES